MASNHSSLLIANHLSELTVFTIYLVEGVFLLIGNVFLLAIIIKYEALRTRKEFIIIGALALADALSSGVANIFGAVYRIPVTMSGNSRDPEYRSTCILTIHSMLWSFSQPCAAFMLFVVSIDRFISIRYPLQYLGYSTRYAYIMVGTAYGISFSESLALTYRAWYWKNGTELVPAGKLCYIVQALLPPDYLLFLSQNTLSALVSVVLYLFVVIEIKRSSKKIQPTLSARQHKDNLAWQKRFTRMMGLSCICTFLFYCMPTVARFLAAHDPHMFIKLGAWTWVVQCVNPLCNLIIYGMKQKEIGKGLKAFMKCKQMPISLSMWQQIM